jgi:aminoglycoside 6'-N-acetyltransferase I
LEIREVRPDERAIWLRLRQSLWPGTPRVELAQEVQEILADPMRNRVLVAVSSEGEVVGFIEVAMRDWAEGCSGRPVGYIEAWYVEPEHRRTGVGRELVQAAEEWVLSQGCNEIASDAELGNDVSARAHEALGYDEVLRLVLFAKKL